MRDEPHTPQELFEEWYFDNSGHAGGHDSAWRVWQAAWYQSLSETKTNSAPNDAIWPPEMELQSMAGGGFQRVKYIRADLVHSKQGIKVPADYDWRKEHQRAESVALKACATSAADESSPHGTAHPFQFDKEEPASEAYVLRLLGRIAQLQRELAESVNDSKAILLENAKLNEALSAKEETVEGKWPKDDLRRAFVEGAKWWEYQWEHATMWPSDVNRAEAEAEKRYPYVGEKGE